MATIRNEHYVQRHEGGWTEARVDLLKKRWNEGRSASQIATELGAGVTRNACISKIHRLGLSGRTGAGGAAPLSRGQTAHQQRKAAALRIPPASPGSRVSPMKKPADVKPGTWNGPAGLPSPPYVPAVVEAGKPPLNLTLLELPATGCKWPVNDGRPEYRFCGQRREGDRPYCPGHSAGAFSAASSHPKHSAKELARSLRRYL